MFYDSQDLEMMHLLQSSQNKPIDFFKQILDNNSDQHIPDCKADIFPQKKIQSQKIWEQLQELDNKPNSYQNLQTKPNKNQYCGHCLEGKIQSFIPSDDDDQLKSSDFQIKNKRIFLSQKIERSQKSTQCYEANFKKQILQKQSEKVQQIKIDFNCTNGGDSSDQQCISSDKKVSKLKKKISKFILREKSFGKALKLSFPKKIVEMFINHYGKFSIDNKLIEDYNDRIRTKLKESKKNDYTFEKQVSQILGESKEEPEIEQNLQKEISRTNRCIFSQIISKTMKEEVIMRDKIAKNRELYMIQLKVYALRCRSHKLSKKGTYK